MEAGRLLERQRLSGADLNSASNLHAFRKLFRSAPTTTARAGSQLLAHRLLTPLGPMIACATDRALCLLEFADRRMLERQLRRLCRRMGALPTPGANAVLDALAREIDGYFEGKLHAFTVPFEQPGSPFQQRVWERLLRIPYGETRSYGQLARELDLPGHARAVARANGDNGLAILVPCHRVVGADGALTGYGGGLWRKRRLLDHEAAHRPHLATSAVSVSN